MKTECVVALDAGSGSGRSAVFNLQGNLLAVAAEDWAPRVPEDEPLGSEFDPEQMWAALCRTTRLALERAGVPADAVRGISTTSQRDGSVFLDAQGKELLCTTNRDARGVLHAEEVAKEFGEQIYRVTGRWPLGLNALDRLGWLRLHRPEVYERIARVFMISDWLVYRLSGRVCSEPTNASSSLLFDVGQHCWSPELAGLLGHSPQVCPRCYHSGEAVGTLTAQASAALCLPGGIPVAMGAADSQAACLGCSSFEDGATTIIAGTTIPVQMVLTHPVFDELHRLHLGAYVTPGRWVLESNGGVAGTSYRWFCETFVGTGAAYAVMEREMQEAEPGEVMAVAGPQIADFRALAFPPKSAFVFPFLGGMERPPKRGAFGRQRRTTGRNRRATGHCAEPVWRIGAFSAPGAHGRRPVPAASARAGGARGQLPGRGHLRGGGGQGLSRCAVGSHSHGALGTNHRTRPRRCSALQGSISQVDHAVPASARTVVCAFQETGGE